MTEWCASQYEVDCDEILGSLTLGLHLAIIGSTEAKEKVLARQLLWNQYSG